MEKDYAIMRVNWHTQRIALGSLETILQIHARFRALIEFLQAHSLTTRTVLRTGDEVTDNSCLLRSDLTEEGFEVYRKAEQKWLRNIERTKNFTDMRLFARELSKSRISA
jgi:hypothetical protein